LHHGYIIVLTGILIYIGSNGFGRYSYTLILPAMRDALGLNHTELGLIAGGNSLAYMIFAPLCGYLCLRWGTRRVVGVSMLLVGVSMLLVGMVGVFWLILPLRFLAGAGNAGSQTPALSLTSAWFNPSRRGLATGIMYSGLGIGLMISGFVTPRLLALQPESGWRLCWEFLGAAVVVLGVISFVLLRDNPAAMGLEPLGPKSASPQSDLTAAAGAGIKSAAAVYRSPFLWRLGLSYFLFGFANLMFFTFLTAALIGEKGFSPESAGQLLALDGLLSLVGALLWGALSDRIRRNWALAAALALAAVSYVLFAFGQSLPILIVAEIIKCLSVGGTATLVLSLAAEHTGPLTAAAGMGLVTTFLGLGQTFGPPSGGFIIDQTGAYWPMLLAAAALTALAAVNLPLKIFTGSRRSG
jgi:sugar phosphate permease